MLTTLSTRTLTAAARTRGSAVSGGPPQYGEIVDSDEVHDEIRELGTQVKTMIAQHLPRHGTSQEQVMWGVRQFGPSKESKRVLNKENDAARLACETGVYCVWRCCEKPRLSGATNDFCCRIGYQHVCFCGHPLATHTMPSRAANSSAAASAAPSGAAAPATDAQLAGWKAPCEEAGCPCARFRYVPNTPLEIGEGWLTRRANWKAAEWSAKCRCGHGHKAHDTKTMRCRTCGGCGGFASGFLCVVCDLPWEAHDTVWESEGVRVREKLPVCGAYAPLAGIDWDVRMAVLTDASMGGRLEPPASHLALQQQQQRQQAQRVGSGVEGGGPRRGIPQGRPSASAVRGGNASTAEAMPGRLPSLATSPSSGSPAPGVTTSPAAAVAVTGTAGASGDPVLDVEYCRFCATVYRRPESKFCSQCGQPRPQRPVTLR